jgi:hypothetical protein
LHIASANVGIYLHFASEYFLRILFYAKKQICVSGELLS